ncbi:MAG: aldo/keto reductase [Acholeplasmataceae bacterium]
MKKIQLGKSDVYVTEIGFGANTVGGHNLYQHLSETEAISVLRTYLRAGGNFIDTAYLYGMGRGEEVIGDIIQEFPRKNLVIASKASYDDQTKQPSNDPLFLKEEVKKSIRRLKTDYIDLYYIHQPDETTDKRLAIKALQELKEIGLIKAIGVSNFTLEQLKEANQDGYVDVIQNRYNLIHRNDEREFFEYLKANNISYIPYTPLASGLLTGKYNKNSVFPEYDRRANNPNFRGRRFSNIMKKIDQLRPIAERYNVSVATLVLAWYLKNPFVTAIIPGAKTVLQVEDNLKADSIQLDDNDYRAIDQLFMSK